MGIYKNIQKINSCFTNLTATTADVAKIGSVLTRN